MERRVSSSPQQPLRVVGGDPSLGSVLRSRRRHDELTQAQLGDRLGVRQQTIGAWEQGERPQSRFAAALAEYLQVPDAEVLSMMGRGSLGDSVSTEATKDDQAAAVPSHQELLAELASSYAQRARSGPLPREEVELYRAFLRQLSE